MRRPEFSRRDPKDTGSTFVPSRIQERRSQCLLEEARARALMPRRTLDRNSCRPASRSARASAAFSKRTRARVDASNQRPIWGIGHARACHLETRDTGHARACLVDYGALDTRARMRRWLLRSSMEDGTNSESVSFEASMRARVPLREGTFTFETPVSWRSSVCTLSQHVHIPHVSSAQVATVQHCSSFGLDSPAFATVHQSFTQVCRVIDSSHY